MSKRKKAISYLGLVQSQFNFENKYKRYIVVPGTQIRVSVLSPTKICINDPNRELMIKFKYNQATPADEHQLHENIKNLIYKVMHSNFIRMDFEDVYQEIWKKIIKSKHTWNENKGTRVSTWIVIVANSVVNSLRQNIIRYNSRFCLYDDLVKDDEDNGTDMADRLKISNDMDTKAADRYAFKDDFRLFCSELTSVEKKVLKTCFDVTDSLKSQKSIMAGKIPMRSVRRKLGMTEDELNNIISGMKQKFYRNFDIYKPVETTEK